MDSISSNAILKHCKNCKELKPATTDFFNKAMYNAGGLHTLCRECRMASRRIRHPSEPLPQGYRKCSMCKEVKPETVEYFYPHRVKGFQGYCKICCNQKALDNYHQGKDRVAKSIRPETITCENCKTTKPATEEYFQKNPVSHHGLYNVCKDCRHEKSRQNRINNPEKYHDDQKLYRITHKEHLREKQRRYLSTERGRALYRVNARNRDARKRNAPGFHTAQDIQNQYERQKGKCYWCGCKLERYHVDHIVPLTRKGSNWPDNLVIACSHCNVSKNNKLPHEWNQGGRLL